MDAPRLFRLIFSGLYWTFTLGLGASLGIYITLGAFSKPEVAEASRVSASITPGDPEASACVKELESAWQDLVGHVQLTFLEKQGPSPDFDADWGQWSEGWRLRLKEVRVRCRMYDRKEMRPIKRLSDHLERLHLAYTTALRSFSDVGRKQLGEVHKGFAGEK